MVYDRYPGFALVVSPKHTDKIKSMKDLASKRVGVSAPGSSTDFFLKYHSYKNGVDPEFTGVIGVGLGRHGGRRDGAGSNRRRCHARSGCRHCSRQNIRTLRFLAIHGPRRIRSAVFGGDYPGGALYTKAGWIATHEKETQALTKAIVATLKWIHSHSPEEIMAKMPPESRRHRTKRGYLEALKNTIPMYSTTGLMDPKGAQAVLEVFSQSSPEVRNAKIDVTKTYTNKYVERASQATGTK